MQTQVNPLATLPTQKATGWRLFLKTVAARAYPRVVGQQRERSWVFFEIFLPMLAVSSYVFVYRAIGADPQDHTLLQVPIGPASGSLGIGGADQLDYYARFHHQRTINGLVSRLPANQLARFLRKRGVGPDSLVGICMHRRPEMIIGILGTLKAGGAYVPLDPTYPRPRLAAMMEDVSLQVLLTTEDVAHVLPLSQRRDQSD